MRLLSINVGSGHPVSRVSVSCCHYQLLSTVCNVSPGWTYLTLAKRTSFTGSQHLNHIYVRLYNSSSHLCSAGIEYFWWKVVIFISEEQGEIYGPIIAISFIWILNSIHTWKSIVLYNTVNRSRYLLQICCTSRRPCSQK